jgi:hypothetical protein
MFLLEILIFKGLTARRLYKSFGVEGLNQLTTFKQLYLCYSMFQTINSLNKL